MTDSVADNGMAMDGSSADPVDRMRDSTKWLMAAIGAAAAALITGLSLSGLGQVTGSQRTLALVGFGLAIGSLLLAAGFAAWMLGFVTIITIESLWEPEIRRHS